MVWKGGSVVGEERQTEKRRKEKKRERIEERGE